MIGVSAFGAIALIILLNTWATSSGEADADMVKTTKSNLLHVSAWQSFAQIGSYPAQLKWVGPAEGSVLAGRKTVDADGDVYTVVKVLGQIGETTLYFDLYDCGVHRVPTIDLAIAHGATYSPTEAGEHKVEDVAMPSEFGCPKVLS